jgi:predicted amidohydrolase YtcJ
MGTFRSFPPFALSPFLYTGSFKLFFASSVFTSFIPLHFSSSFSFSFQETHVREHTSLIEKQKPWNQLLLGNLSSSGLASSFASDAPSATKYQPTGMMSTVRERSTLGEKCKELAWWLRAARRDPK